MANYYNKDLYKILDLNFDASFDEIKVAYRKLVRMYHPDVSKNIDNADKFKEIQEAYEILINDDSRKKYDILHGFYRQKLKKDYEQKLKDSSIKYDSYIKKTEKKVKKNEKFSSSINEALDNLFYGKKLNNNRNQSNAINGEDINIDISISSFEALNGTNRKVNILHTQPCSHCNGRKFINGAQCPMCKGTGELSIQKKINVKIPKGVKTGSKVRVRKEGNKGLYGGKDGDLYLIINVEKNPYFDIDGLDIICNLPITPYEAVLGAEISLPIPMGNIMVKIPPMTSSGQKLKIPSQGLENRNKTKKGDIIITVSIKLPNNLSNEEKILYEKLKNISSFDIRKDFNNVK